MNALLRLAESSRRLLEWIALGSGWLLVIMAVAASRRVARSCVLRNRRTSNDPRRTVACDGTDQLLLLVNGNHGRFQVVFTVFGFAVSGGQYARRRFMP